jgi:hypothetical protein
VRAGRDATTGEHALIHNAQTKERDADMTRLVIEDERETNAGYTAYLDGRVVGRASWVLVREQTVLLPHVEVDAAVHDLGIGSLLVRHAIEDARAEGHTALALCPYVRRWAQLHPAYSDVVRKPAPGELAAISALLAVERTLRKLHHEKNPATRA